MTAQEFFIVTAEQRDALTALNSPDASINPRAIDSPSAGTGINLNATAADYAPGAAVTLAGKFAAPKRIVDDPDYQAYVPAMITYLLDLPYALLEATEIFAPVAD